MKTVKGRVDYSDFDFTEYDWRSPVNQLLYAIQFNRTLDDSVVARITHSILIRGILGEGAPVYMWGIKRALASGDLVNDLEIRHGEEEIKDFLSRLADSLEAARPWPDVPNHCGPEEA